VKRSSRALLAIRRIATGVAVVVGLVVAALTVWFLLSPSAPPGHLERVGTNRVDPELAGVGDRSLEMGRDVAVRLGLASVSFAASVGGDVVWQAAMGLADVKREELATATTLYRTGSVAKPMTSVVLGRLVEAGLLDLDMPVRTYLPEVEGPLGEATLRQLAGHSAGVRHYAGPPARDFWTEQFTGRHFETAREALPLVLGDPLRFAPGEGFAYSTHGYTVLAAAMEAATGKGILELLDEYLTGPLGMRNTLPDDVRRMSGARATTYIRRGNRFLIPPDPDPSYKWAGGGLLSTPTDLVRMAGGLMTGGILGPGTVEELWTPLPLPDGQPNPQNYGLGWRIDPGAAGEDGRESLRTVHHGGSIIGGSSFLLLLPEDEVAVAVMTNATLSDPGPLREVVYRMAGLWTIVARERAERELVRELAR
jgi:CubicO group peptidase (beta-lactamase class C family)